MRVILVDDESLALMYLEGLIKKIQNVEVVGTYINPQEALVQILEQKPDAVFLDIEMPGLNGIELAERIQEKDSEIHIVFVTAYNEYAVKAFELNAVDYVVKPIQNERLQQTLERIPLNLDKDKVRKSDYEIVCAFQSISFATFGDVLKEVDVKWRTAKVRGVFSFLLQHHGAYVRKDTLLELFWPEADLEKGNMQLYSTIYQIRKTISTAGFKVAITNHENGYRLDLNGVKFDVDEWEQGLKSSSDVNSETLQDHKRLLELYKGDYLAGEDYIWAESERERLRVLWLQHCSKVADYFTEESQFSKAISLYLQVQVAQPYVDQSYFKLMKLYYKIGDIRAVEEQFSGLTKMLENEYDIKPSKNIVEWYEQTKQRS